MTQKTATQTKQSGKAPDAPETSTQRAAINSAPVPAVPPIAYDVLRSPGLPLAAATRAFLEPRFGQDFSRVHIHSVRPGALQAQLTVSMPGDVYEQEADRVAAAIVGGGALDRFAESPAAPQRKESRGAAPPVVQDLLRSSGQPLDAATRAQMEPRFGQDFSCVQVHNDPQAVASARAINARAYTVGSHVVFGGGQYAPETKAGQRLLAHELTHVVQQRGGAGAGLAMRDTSDAGIPGPARNPQPAAAAKKPDDPTLWFQDPKVAGDSTQPDRKRVFVETSLSQINAVPAVSVRFAYPLSELVSGGGSTNVPSSKIASAKTQILSLIADVIADFGSYPAGTAEEQRGWKQDRARLKEAFTGFTAGKPFNVFIATIDSPGELLSGVYVPTTDQVFVDIKDVGDKSKLQAAIRLPLQNLVGGVSANSGKQSSAQSKDELKKTMLHEALHTMLINRGIDSDAQWNKFKAQSKIQGSATAQAKAEELIRKFLISQEEVFVYESVGLLYPPIEASKASYDVFIASAARLLKKKGSALQKVSQSITVIEKVDKKPVTWSITYDQPGSLTVEDADVPVMNLILTAWPLRF